MDELFFYLFFIHYSYADQETFNTCFLPHGMRFGRVYKVQNLHKAVYSIVIGGWLTA